MNTICMHTCIYIYEWEKRSGGRGGKNDVLNCRTSKKKNANDNKRKEMSVSYSNDSHDDDTIDQ
jgi:hypothetical protein